MKNGIQQLLSKGILSTMGIVAAALALTMPASAQTALLAYNFNDAAGTTAANSGSVGASANLTMYSAANVATDYLSPYSTGGIAFPDGSGTFNLTSATGMGSAGTGPYTLSTTAGSAVAGAQSLTISGWYNTAVTSSWSSARFMNIGNIVFDANSANTPILQVGSSSYIVGSGNNAAFATSAAVANDWVFTAATYNQSATGTDQVVIYQGVRAANGTLGTLNSVTFSIIANQTVSGSGLDIGNSSFNTTGLNNRGWDGSLDNFDVFASTTDNTGALTTAQLNALYMAQAVPEPSVSLALALGLFVLGVMGQRRLRSARTA